MVNKQLAPSGSGGPAGTLPRHARTGDTLGSGARASLGGAQRLAAGH